MSATDYFDGRLFGEVFVTLTVIMNPLGTVPVLLALTNGRTNKARHRLAWQAVLTAGTVIGVFAVFGQSILSYLGITLAALQGAGGLLLLLVALQLLTVLAARVRMPRRLIVAVISVPSAVLLGLPAASAASAFIPSPQSVAAALERSPVYVDPHADPPHVDAARVLPVVPSGTYFASVPRSDRSAGADPAAVPALLSSQVGRGGTFIVLAGGRLHGASTTIPGRLGEELATAQAGLPAHGDATATLVALMRSLSGSGDLQDAAGPNRAGGPVGAGLLVGIGIAAAGGALALWWWLHRPPRRRARPAPSPRDLVEIDHAGRVIRRVAARDRQP